MKTMLTAVLAVVMSWSMLAAEVQESKSVDTLRAEREQLLVSRGKAVKKQDMYRKACTKAAFRYDQFERALRCRNDQEYAASCKDDAVIKLSQLENFELHMKAAERHAKMERSLLDNATKEVVRINSQIGKIEREIKKRGTEPAGK